MVAMNKWQDITDTEVCQGAKWSASVIETLMLEPPYRVVRLAFRILQAGPQRRLETTSLI
jgi:hypothetical protein